MRVSFLTLPLLKTEYAADHAYVVPRVRDSSTQIVTHLDNAARKFPHVVLVAGAGLGKTSALQYISSRTQARVLSFADFHPNALPTNFDSDHWILLDDVSDAAHVAHLEALAAKFPNAKIWATTRDAKFIPPSFTALGLESLNEREIVSLAEAWFPLSPKSESRINRPAQDFIASVQANAGTRELAITPLYLFLLLQVYAPQSAEAIVAAHVQAQAAAANLALPVIGGAATPFDVPQRTNISPLPPRRAELFDEYVRAKLSRDSDPEFAARALEGIALSTKRGNRAQKDHLERGYDFLVERPSGRVEFRHALLQDFLAARALRRNPDFAPMRETLFESEWRDVALFYAGLGGVNDVASAAVEQGDMEFAAYAIAAASEPPAILEQVVKTLVARAWEDHDEHAMRALGALRNNQASDFFAAKLRDKNVDVRQRASYILGRMHTDRALEYLLPQLRDPSPDVRDQVVASLGMSRSERVIEPLLVALRGDPRVASSDTRMKIAAAKALGEYGTDKAVPALMVDLQVSEPEIRDQAMLALEKIRSDFAVKPLESISTTDKHPEVRDAALTVLKNMQGQ